MRSGWKESRSTNSVEITTREAGRSPRSTRSRICVAVAHTVSTLVSMLVNSGVVHWENRELFSPTMGMLISLACSAFCAPTAKISSAAISASKAMPSSSNYWINSRAGCNSSSASGICRISSPSSGNPHCAKPSRYP